MAPRRPERSGAIAVAIAAGLVAGLVAAAPQPPSAIAAGIAGAVAVAFGTWWRRVGSLLAGFGVIAMTWLVEVLAGLGLSPAAVLGAGIGCLLACELGCSAAGAVPRPPGAGRRFERARAAHLAVVVAVSLAVGAFGVALGTRRRGGALAELAGLAVAAALVAAVAALARRRGRAASGG